MISLDPQTLGLIALIIHVLMRLLKTGQLKQLIPGRFRPFVALALGGIAMAVDAIALGTEPGQAALTAALAVGAAVLAHDTVIEGARGGKELFQ